MRKNNYTAILFELLPYYFNKLKKIYSGRKNIKIIRRFITHNNSKKKLFFYIPSKNIKLMNGDGPFNDWAGGQGSFSKKFIINEIYKNNFRGNKCNINIQKFIDEISSLTVPCDRISKYKISKLEISLLALDVQGYEYYILKSINFKKQKFSIIYLEDEDPQSIISTKMRRLLKINSYKLVGHEGPDYVYSLVQ